MVDSSEEHPSGGTFDRSQKRRFMIFFIVKCGLGLLSLVLAGLGVQNTSGQTNQFGTPYYVGAFLLGFMFIMAGLVDILIYRNIYLRADNSTAQKELAQYVCIETGFTAVSALCAGIGIFIVGIYGVPDCDPRDFFSHCNYTKNISANRTIAILILVTLLVSLFVAIGSIILHCRICRGVGLQGRRNYGITVQQQGFIGGGVGPANFVYTTAPEPPRYFGRGNAYRRGYDDFSRDTQIIIDGQVIDKGHGGFQGAVLSQPQNVTVVHPPPPGNPQYSGQAGQYTQGGGGAQGYGQSAPNTVNDLQEQNRLLREQIALQQQQLNLMQQQQHDNRAPSPSFPPPPSYESCLQDPSQINLLQEQNKELQNRYQSQQEQLEKTAPPSDVRNEPSAPPML